MNPWLYVSASDSAIGWAKINGRHRRERIRWAGLGTRYENETIKMEVFPRRTTVHT